MLTQIHRPEHLALLDQYVAKVYELGMNRPMPTVADIKAQLPKLKRSVLVCVRVVVCVRAVVWVHAFVCVHLAAFVLRGEGVRADIKAQLPKLKRNVLVCARVRSYACTCERGCVCELFVCTHSSFCLRVW